MSETLLIATLYIGSITALCLALSKLPLLSKEGTHRVSSLDGLRGILATAVVAHHFTINYHWHTTGLWQMTDSRIINNMGAVPVSLFFIITGYLFGGKIHHGTPNWGQIFASRARRIYPMYLLSVAAIFATSLYMSEEIHPFTTKTLQEILKWSIFVGVPINEFKDSTKINSSVHWTLLYEAVFYLSLPLVYCITRRKRPGSAAVISVLAIALLWPEYKHHFHSQFIKLFAVGFISAILEKKIRKDQRDYKNLKFTLIALTILGACMLMKPYSKLQMILLGIPFIIFVLGNSLNGILENKGMKTLGEASFSIYLIHGILIYTLFSTISIHDFGSGNITSYALYLPLVMTLTCSISIATYWLIERPFLKKRKIPITTPESLTTLEPSSTTEK